MNIQRFYLPGGRILTYREIGHGRPLVLLHGWGMSSLVFTELASELSGEFRVLMPDLPGHGGSDPADTEGLDGLCTDLATWCKGLDLRNFALLGWSLGGMVTLRLAQQLTERIERLILVATTPRFVSNEDWPHGLPDVQVRALSRNLRRNFGATLHDFFLQQFRGDTLAASRLEHLASWASPLNALPDETAAHDGLEILCAIDLRPQLAAIRQPTLVVHGNADPIIPHGAGEFLATALPDAHLMSLPGIGHAPFLSCPAECAARMREFLS